MGEEEDESIPSQPREGTRTERHHSPPPAPTATATRDAERALVVADVSRPARLIHGVSADLCVQEPGAEREAEGAESRRSKFSPEYWAHQFLQTYHPYQRAPTP